MRQAQPGPQQRALGAVQAQQAVGRAVVQQPATLREQPAPHPGGIQPAALDGEIGQFLERVHLAQRLVELHAVDDQGPAWGRRQPARACWAFRACRAAALERQASQDELLGSQPLLKTIGTRVGYSASHEAFQVAAGQE